MNIGRARAIIDEGVTSDRVTHLTFDMADQMVVEPAFVRTVKRRDLKAAAAVNTTRLISGGWILKPLNADFWVQHEETNGQLFAIRLSEMAADPHVVEIPAQRVLSELIGIGASGAVSATGDYYMTKRVAAGATWAPSFTTATPQIPYATQHYPMDFVMSGPVTAMETPDTGYILKFIVPGTQVHAPDNILTFYFGGAIVGQGYGVYALALKGDASAQLFEYFNGTWNLVNGWQYARPADLLSTLQVIRIIPHLPNNIEFQSFVTPAVPTYSEILTEVTKSVLLLQQSATARTTLHQNLNRGSLSPAPGGGTNIYPITGYGRFALEVRRDIRLIWQIQRIAYPASGTLTELPFTVPYSIGNTNVLALFPDAWRNVQGDTVLTDVTEQILDPDTAPAGHPENATPRATATSSYTWKGAPVSEFGWVLPGDLNKCAFQATLSSNESAPRYRTPVLYGYEARRNCAVNSVANGEKTGGIFRHISITGPDTNPDHETAHFILSDLKDEIPILRTRGKIPLLIETEYDRADSSKKAVLFDGYTGRVEARRRRSTSPNYPSANWHDYSIDAIGKWDRLQGHWFEILKSFFDSSDAPHPFPDPTVNQAKAPWQVTDAIRWTLFQLGFTDDQLDVFDDPIRFFGNPAAATLDLAGPLLGKIIQEWLVEVARMYLNAFLVRDRNAGVSGMWRLLRPPTPDTPPIWHFVTTPQPAGHLPHKSGAYGTNTSPVLGRGSLVSYIVPPEANVLRVIGSAKAVKGETGQLGIVHLENRVSYNAPGFSQADPQNIDYLGFVKRLEYKDVTIDTPEALAFVARRVFALACHGRKYSRFTSELVLVEPNDPVYTVRKRRPLRIGDVVTLDGIPQIVHSANFWFTKSWNQMQTMETELLRRDLTFY